MKQKPKINAAYWLVPDSCSSNCLMLLRSTCVVTVTSSVWDSLTPISNEVNAPQPCPQTNWIRKSPEIPSDNTGLCKLLVEAT